MKRKLARIQKRHRRISLRKFERVTSPFFTFDAAIRIGGAGQFHDEIFTKTGLVPSHSHLAGEKVSSHSAGVRKEDIWVLNSPLDRSKPLDEHIDWLLKTITPHIDYLSNITKNASWADLCLGCLSDIPYPIISTSESATELIKQLNLTIAFNFTCR
ncbi:MAG: DUF4279 domain-containing protein [Gallionella sp.]|jgi:hypothetical protein